jgi:hypothetical protein
MKKSTILFGAICAVILAFSQNAKADTISYTLGIPNTGIAGFPGPYATVLVDRTSTSTATITFTSLTATFNGDPIIYLMGDGGTAAVNVNGSFTLGSITGNNGGTGFTPGPYSQGPAGNSDGFGSFNLQIDSFDGYTHSSDTVSFDLTGGNWANAGSVLTANNDGFLAAAHIFPASFPADANVDTFTGQTGFAANGGGTVPDGGATAALLGLGLAGLAGIRARFGRK